MAFDYETYTDPRHLLPRRFIVRPGVVSPLTCRHPKHVRCSCHGDSAAAHQQQPKAQPPAKQTKAQAQAIREVELTYHRHLSAILFAIRRFPEACAAVNELLSASPSPLDGASKPEEDDDDPNAPFPC